MPVCNSHRPLRDFVPNQHPTKECVSTNSVRPLEAPLPIITISVDFLPSLFLSVFPAAVKRPCSEALVSSAPLRSAGLSLVRCWQILHWGNVLQSRNKAIISHWRGERQDEQGVNMGGDRDILINQVRAGN